MLDGQMDFRRYLGGKSIVQKVTDTFFLPHSVVVASTGLYPTCDPDSRHE
jgi:hypothetical protein